MIILFNGPPACGKDHAADFFKAKGYKHLSFKYRLYEETIKYFNVDKEWFMDRYENRDLKEVRCQDLGHMSCREAMIYVSEKVIKPRMGLDYFGKLVANEIDLEKDYAISDGGFIDELLPVVEKVGKENFRLVQLTREGHDFSSDSRRYFDGNITKEYVLGHSTSIEKKYVLPHKFDVKSYRIHNNSTVEDFNDSLKEIYENEINIDLRNRRNIMINKEEVTKALHEGVCSVTFTKVNGDERVMAATLKADLLPEVVEKVLAEGETPKAAKKPNPNVLAVYDVDKSGWRSFRWDSIKAFQAG